MFNKLYCSRRCKVGAAQLNGPLLATAMSGTLFRENSILNVPNSRDKNGFDIEPTKFRSIEFRGDPFMGGAIYHSEQMCLSWKISGLCLW